MPKCQLGMQENVQGHRIASVCKQTYDANCMYILQAQQLNERTVNGLAQFQVRSVRQARPPIGS